MTHAAGTSAVHAIASCVVIRALAKMDATQRFRQRGGQRLAVFTRLLVDLLFVQLSRSRRLGGALLQIPKGRGGGIAFLLDPQRAETRRLRSLSRRWGGPGEFAAASFCSRESDAATGGGRFMREPTTP